MARPRDRTGKASTGKVSTGRARPGATSPGGYEWVDAEAPDWVHRRGFGRDGDGEARVSTPAVAGRREVAALLRRATRLAATLGSRPVREQAKRGKVAARAGGSAASPGLPSAWAERELAELEFCAIDLETTGGGAEQDDDILEIGAVVLGGGDLRREFTTLVQPRQPVTRAARAVHGIPDAALLEAPRLGQALPWLAEIARGRVLVFHNAGFDLPFLQRALAETGREALAAPVVDTVVLSRRLLGPPAALGLVASRLGLVTGNLHRALEDARTTARVLAVLLDVLAAAGVARLDAVPGVFVPGARGRSRRRPEVDPLLLRLERAVAAAEHLQLSYHVGAGVAPVELWVQPLRLEAATCLLALDVERGRRVRLELARIGPVQRRG